MCSFVIFWSVRGTRVQLLDYIFVISKRPIEFEARGRGPRAIHKTKGTVFPDTDRPWLVNNIFFFPKLNKWLRKEPE